MKAYRYYFISILTLVLFICMSCFSYGSTLNQTIQDILNVAKTATSIDSNYIQITPNPINIGAVQQGKTVTKTIEITNVSSGGLWIKPDISAPFSLEDSTMFTLSKGESKKLTIQYTASTIGDYKGKLLLTYYLTPNRTVGHTISVPVTVSVGQDPSNLTISTDRILKNKPYTLTWSPCDNAISYSVLEYKDGNFIHKYNVNNNSITLKHDVSNKTPYKYYILANYKYGSLSSKTFKTINIYPPRILTINVHNVLGGNPYIDYTKIVVKLFNKDGKEINECYSNQDGQVKFRDLLPDEYSYKVYNTKGAGNQIEYWGEGLIIKWEQGNYTASFYRNMPIVKCIIANFFKKNITVKFNNYLDNKTSIQFSIDNTTTKTITIGPNSSKTLTVNWYPGHKKYIYTLYAINNNKKIIVDTGIFSYKGKFVIYHANSSFNSTNNSPLYFIFNTNVGQYTLKYNRSWIKIYRLITNNNIMSKLIHLAANGGDISKDLNTYEENKQISWKLVNQTANLSNNQIIKIIAKDNNTGRFRSTYFQIGPQFRQIITQYQATEAYNELVSSFFIKRLPNWQLYYSDCDIDGLLNEPIISEIKDINTRISIYRHIFIDLIFRDINDYADKNILDQFQQLSEQADSVSEFTADSIKLINPLLNVSSKIATEHSGISNDLENFSKLLEILHKSLLVIKSIYIVKDILAYIISLSCVTNNAIYHMYALNKIFYHRPLTDPAIKTALIQAENQAVAILNHKISRLLNIDYNSKEKKEILEGVADIILSVTPAKAAALAVNSIFGALTDFNLAKASILSGDILLNTINNYKPAEPKIYIELPDNIDSDNASQLSITEMKYIIAQYYIDKRLDLLQGNETNDMSNILAHFILNISTNINDIIKYYSYIDNSLINTIKIIDQRIDKINQNNNNQNNNNQNNNNQNNNNQNNNNQNNNNQNNNNQNNNNQNNNNQNNNNQNNNNQNNNNQNNNNQNNNNQNNNNQNNNNQNNQTSNLIDYIAPINNALVSTSNSSYFIFIPKFDGDCQIIIYSDQNKHNLVASSEDIQFNKNQLETIYIWGSAFNKALKSLPNGTYYWQIFTANGAIGNLQKFTISNSTINNNLKIDNIISNISNKNPLTVTFICHTETTNIVKYLWDFNGDGRIDYISTNNKATYTYNKYGKYAVRITIINNSGQKLTKEIYLNLVSKNNESNNNQNNNQNNNPNHQTNNKSNTYNYRKLLYCISKQNKLYSIDPNTGKTNLIAKINGINPFLLASSPDGYLYGLCHHKLVKIDPKTGNIVKQLTLTGSLPYPGGMACDKDGHLYVMSGFYGALHSINLKTGKINNIYGLNLPKIGINSLLINFNTNKLYGLISSDYRYIKLIEINIKNKQVKTIVNLKIPNIYNANLTLGSEYDPYNNKIYAIIYNKLLTINVNTKSIQVIATLPFVSGSLAMLWPNNSNTVGNITYKIILAPGIKWEDAKKAAEKYGAGWHLATILNKQQEDAVVNLIKQLHVEKELWLGGYQKPINSPPAKNWHWVTGAKWNYTNWAPGEPNDCGGDEHYLCIHTYDNKNKNVLGKWNDERFLFNIGGYIIEHGDISNNSQLKILSLTATPLKGSEPLTVKFTCLAQDQNATIQDYKWDFNGDGITDTITYSGNVQYTYYNPGKYIATVTVEDSNGNKITKDVTIQVSQNEAPVINSFSIANSITGTPNYMSAHVPFIVIFNCNAYDPDGYITKYEWDFNGDGKIDHISTNGTVSYTYDLSGNYTPTVTVVDNKGAESKANDITIHAIEPNKHWYDITSNLYIKESRPLFDIYHMCIFTYITIKNLSPNNIPGPIRLDLINPSIPVNTRCPIGAKVTGRNLDSNTYYFDLVPKNGILSKEKQIKIRINFRLERKRLRYQIKIKRYGVYFKKGM